MAGNRYLKTFKLNLKDSGFSVLCSRKLVQLRCDSETGHNKTLNKTQSIQTEIETNRTVSGIEFGGVHFWVAVISITK